MPTYVWFIRRGKFKKDSTFNTICKYQLFGYQNNQMITSLEELPQSLKNNEIEF